MGGWAGDGSRTSTFPTRDDADDGTYVEDLAELMGTLDLTNTVLMGHSTGGGVIARYIAVTEANA